MPGKMGGPVKGRWRSRVASLLVLGTSLLIAALLGEGVLRLTIKDRINLFPRFHDAVTYGDFTIRRYRPGLSFWHTSIDGRWHFTINNRGFRDSADYEYEKPEGTLRILALGDSHTSGYEVRQDYSYPEVLEQVLSSHGISAQTINSGISGFSTAEQLVFLENEGIKYSPDFVIVGFYANDFEDNIKANIFRLEEGKLRVLNTVHTPGIRIHNLVTEASLLRWLSQHSYLYSFAFNTAYEVAKIVLLSRARAEAETEVAIATTDRVGSYEQELGVALLQRMYNFCKVNGAQLLIVDIPQVSPPGKPIISSVPESLRREFESSSDAFLHGSEVFIEFANDPGRIHVPHGHQHISELAHAAIARSSANVIVQALDRAESR
jgi:lysophospholipase L1-like esterase